MVGIHLFFPVNQGQASFFVYVPSFRFHTTLLLIDLVVVSSTYSTTNLRTVSVRPVYHRTYVWPGEPGSLSESFFPWPTPQATRNLNLTVLVASYHPKASSPKQQLQQHYS